MYYAYTKREWDVVVVPGPRQEEYSETEILGPTVSSEKDSEIFNDSPSLFCVV